jgi:hypothetical protein
MGKMGAKWEMDKSAEDGGLRWWSQSFKGKLEIRGSCEKSNKLRRDPDFFGSLFSHFAGFITLTSSYP